MSEYRFAAPPRPELTEPDVTSPAHYSVGGIECIDYMQSKSTDAEFRGYLRLSVLKYLSRAGHKDAELQEYKKAAVFLNWLINYMETGFIRPEK